MFNIRLGLGGAGAQRISIPILNLSVGVQPEFEISQRKTDVGSAPEVSRPDAIETGSEGGENHFRIQASAARSAPEAESMGNRSRDTCL